MSLLARLAPLGIVLGLTVPFPRGLEGQGRLEGPALTVAQDDLSAAPRISMSEFEKLLKANGVMVIDVRDGASYSAGHIPGAILMPLTFEKRLPELRSATRPIVVYCA